jgi:F-type H+-transporting ATPase subunit b
LLIASQNFLVPGPTFVVELAIFLGVLGVLAKWVLPYVNRAMDQRQESIARSIREAEEAKKRADELEKRYQEVLEQGRIEAQQLKDEATKVGEQLREQLHQKGEEEYDRLLARASANIEASARQAREELRGQVAGLVMTVVERVLGEGLIAADQAALIDRAIAEVEAQAAARPDPAATPAATR